MVKLQRRYSKNSKQYTATVPIRLIEQVGWNKGEKLQWKMHEDGLKLIRKK